MSSAAGAAYLRRTSRVDWPIPSPLTRSTTSNPRTGPEDSRLVVPGDRRDPPARRGADELQGLGPATLEDRTVQPSGLAVRAEPRGDVAGDPRLLGRLPLVE